MSATIYFSNNIILKNGFINPDMRKRAVYFTISTEKLLVLLQSVNIVVLDGRVDETLMFNQTKEQLETKRIDFSEIHKQNVIKFTEKEEKEIKTIKMYVRDMKYCFIRNM